MAASTKRIKPKYVGARAKKSEAKKRSLLAQGTAEIVYRPTHYAPPPMPGVVLSGRRSEGRVTQEGKGALIWNERSVRKTNAKRKVKPETPIDFRSMEEVQRVFTSRKGNVIVIPLRSERKDQPVTPKLHKPAEEHSQDKLEFLADCKMSARDLIYETDAYGEQIPRLVQVRDVKFKREGSIKISRVNPDRLEERDKRKLERKIGRKTGYPDHRKVRKEERKKAAIADIKAAA